MLLLGRLVWESLNNNGDFKHDSDVAVAAWGDLTYIVYKSNPFLMSTSSM